MLTLYNTIHGKKESFKPLTPHNVTLYVCGVTPYSDAHIGHGRSAVSFDILYRLLTFLGYTVQYVRNFTDIDDKLLKKAEEQYGDPTQYKKIAEKFISQYQDEIAALDCKTPSQEPRVTDNISIIIDFINDLIAQGFAYQVNDDVYFDVARYKEYGKLSKQKLDALCTGTRIELDERKKNPLDFALWKCEKEGTYFKSPWGYGRPGWHIECSALASQYLADQIDIHGGGIDLIFPHHENEIAQSEARSGKQFVRYWIHNGLVNIDKQKMSKSLGNILSLNDLLKKYDPMLLRYYLVLHHYRTPLEFSFEELEKSKKNYNRLAAIFQAVPVGKFDSNHMMQMPIVSKMLSFLSDDLNSPGMFGVLFENVDTLKKDQQQLSAAKQLLHDILGLSLIPLKEEVTLTPEIQKLLDERKKARIQKNWKRADEIRDQLIAMGIEPQDKKID